LECENAEEKIVVVITGRFHPGESNSSWMIQGLMDYLNKNSGEYKMRNFLRKTIIKIIPMMNPDGVIMGNFRCDLVGNDINRIFSESYEQVCP
jgi:cytosolic carboxypeptidase protein 2/3